MLKYNCRKKSSALCKMGTNEIKKKKEMERCKIHRKEKKKPVENFRRREQAEGRTQNLYLRPGNLTFSNF